MLDVFEATSYERKGCETGADELESNLPTQAYQSRRGKPKAIPRGAVCGIAWETKTPSQIRPATQPLPRSTTTVRLRCARDRPSAFPWFLKKGGRHQISFIKCQNSEMVCYVLNLGRYSWTG